MKTVSEELKLRIKRCLLELPVTINTHFGDPFQPSQWEDTLRKLTQLKNDGHKGEIEVSTKWIITEDQIEELYEINPDLWIICGITGMNEMPGVSQSQRFENYMRISNRFPRTILNVRPIIPGRNDSIEIIRPMIELASKGRKLLKHGGYRDPNIEDVKKTQYDKLKQEIHELCVKVGVNDGPRCSNIVSDVTGKVNSTYSKQNPENIDVLEALGYRFEDADGIINLKGFGESSKVTKGDVSFARLIIHSSKILGIWDDYHVNTQLKGPNGQMIFCTSSWFHWAREVPCMVDCDYCHVRPGTRIFLESGDSGCSPLDLYKHMFDKE